ncbi:hypothetical protein NDU88_005480 [Pleurodeles waltl]|uniref:Uncharacterized protein n=1 Tax=Pleurodeles waltl TaxID=8319 RepID=A0AAV7WUU1_PLEWA|nr:hypothetical protein NDU88_005480 [Pleurodeles waltl]
MDGGGGLRTLLLGGVAVWVMRPDAAAWEEQRPGPAQKWVVNAGEYAGCARCGGHGEQEMRKGSNWEERMSDVSLEEGELRTSRRCTICSFWLNEAMRSATGRSLNDSTHSWLEVEEPAQTLQELLQLEEKGATSVILLISAPAEPVS